MATDYQFPGPKVPYTGLEGRPHLSITSTSFDNDAEIPERCAAPSNITPQLSWTDIPEGTQSFAITCYDPDAPTGAGYWHWAVLNIPVDMVSLPEGISDNFFVDYPDVLVLKGDSGLRSYYGPQPPAGHGPHRYIFTVYAVDVPVLDIAPDNTPTVLGFNMFAHALGYGTHTGWYETAS